MSLSDYTFVPENAALELENPVSQLEDIQAMLLCTTGAYCVRADEVLSGTNITKK